MAFVVVPVGSVRLWSPEAPFLYDVSVRMRAVGHAEDAVESYMGLRTLGTRGRALLLNGQPRF
ncbi:MAG TPA: hypothetical protein PK384_14315, partial [Candidatus Latescibacteria bacterium]|nr:hypothetical protein [Candidatus Latescibacterota bacterium]